MSPSPFCGYVNLFLTLLPLNPSGASDNTTSAPNKKKKGANKHSNYTALDPNDEAALNRRAARFQREHEIERRKQNALPHRQFANLSISRSNTPSSSSWFGDEPEGDPVCLLSLSVFPSLLHALRRLD